MRGISNTDEEYIVLDSYFNLTNKSNINGRL